MEALHTAWAFFIPVHNCVINIRLAEIVATVSQLSPWPENIKDSEFTEITISIKLMKMSS